jgi:hypothetical protein
VPVRCAEGDATCGRQWLDHEALGAADLDDAEAVTGADFLLHAVEMIFHGLLGKAEAVRDFLVGEPFGNKRYQLLPAGA